MFPHRSVFTRNAALCYCGLSYTIRQDLMPISDKTSKALLNFKTSSASGKQPTPTFPSFLPLEVFDNNEFDCRTPEEWVNLGEFKLVTVLAIGTVFKVYHYSQVMSLVVRESLFRVKLSYQCWSHSQCHPLTPPHTSHPHLQLENHLQTQADLRVR